MGYEAIELGSSCFGAAPVSLNLRCKVQDGKSADTDLQGTTSSSFPAMHQSSSDNVHVPASQRTWLAKPFVVISTLPTSSWWQPLPYVKAKCAGMGHGRCVLKAHPHGNTAHSTLRQTALSTQRSTMYFTHLVRAASTRHLNHSSSTSTRRRGRKRELSAHRERHVATRVFETRRQRD